MVQGNRTKQAFADTLIEMSRSKTIREIQVKDLCQTCGIDRTTFYYHFRDKFDLVAWIYISLYLEEEKSAEIINSEEMIVHMLKRIWTHRSFFRNALQDTSQNSLGEYLLDFYISNERKIVCKYLGIDTLDEETEYIIKQYSFGCLMHTAEWLLGKNSLSAEAFGHYQYMCMPEILKAAWKKEAEEKAATGI